MISQPKKTLTAAAQMSELTIIDDNLSHGVNKPSISFHRITRNTPFKCIPEMTSLDMHRCLYDGAAAEIGSRGKSLKTRLALLIKTKLKWGFD